jgi:hypothetical protein
MEIFFVAKTHLIVAGKVIWLWAMASALTSLSISLTRALFHYHFKPALGSRSVNKLWVASSQFRQFTYKRCGARGSVFLLAEQRDIEITSTLLALRFYTINSVFLVRIVVCVFTQSARTPAWLCGRMDPQQSPAIYLLYNKICWQKLVNRFSLKLGNYIVEIFR